MAGEIQVRNYLTIKKGNLFYNPQTPAFTTSMLGVPAGPTPGSLLIGVHGTLVDLSQLSVPGLIRFTNLDSSIQVRWGVYCPDFQAFVRVGDVWPGESWLFRLASDFGADIFGTGTGTGTGGPGGGIGPGTGQDQLMMQSLGAVPVRVFVECFET